MRIYIKLALIPFMLLACEKATQKEVKLVNIVISPSGEMSALPYLYAQNGTTLLSWVEKVNDSVSKLQYTALVEGKWQTPKEIITGNDWFINWADFPAIAENNGLLLSHILKKSAPNTFAYDVKLNLFDKTKWQTDLALNTDGTLTEHGFVTMLPYKDNFFITWLDGRHTGNSAGHDDGAHQGAMTIRAAEITATGSVLNETVLDIKTCDCCQTTAAITDNGPVVIYRDRSDEEIRDMAIVRLIDGQWTAPKIVHADNWKIKGCPVNGPKAAVDGNNLAVTWFTAANDAPKINLVFSTDAGENFAEPIVISDTHPMGRVDIVMIDADNVIVSWMESLEKSSQLKAMKVNKSGEKSEVIIITTMSPSRKSGFPQMELVKDKVYFAWTHVEGKLTRVKMAFINLNKF